MALTEKLTAIADAIRAKTGKTDAIFLSNFASEINDISTGIDTSDATAAASDILNGKTAYVNGQKITGTISSQAAKTITPSSSVQTAVAAGKYTTGAVQVAAIPSSYIQLNFTVVGGTSTPSSPTENMIWVNTSTSITSWTFAAAEPANPTNGMVWIDTGVTSSVEFNALKKNCIQIYPQVVKQYISGAWVGKEVKSYKNGEWVNWWNGKLYSYGVFDEFVTGGYYVSRANTEDNIFREDSTGLYSYVYRYSNNFFTFNNKIDLSNVSSLTLYFDNYTTVYSGTTVTLAVTSGKNTDYNSATNDILASISKSGDSFGTSATLTLDVTDIDEGYVCIGHQTTGNYNTSSMTIREVKGELA